MVLAVQSNAQNYYRVVSDTSYNGQSLELNSFNYYNSNKFNNELIDKFIFGGFISEEIKNDNQKRLNNISNTIGAESEQNLTYINYDWNWFKKYPQLGIKINLQDYHYSSATVTKDLYNLSLYGNENYLGDTLYFKNSHAQYSHYQKIGFGFINKETHSSLTLSYVNATNQIDFRSGDSWLISSSTSDSIVFNLYGEGMISDTNATYFIPSGGGFSLDFEYNMTFYNQKNQPQHIQVNLSNFGLIFWNNQSRTYSVDSSLTFSGFELQQLIDKDSSEALLEVDTLGIVKKLGNRTTFMPAQIVIQKLPNRLSSQKWQMIYGFKAILTSDYKPYGYAGAYYQPFDSFSASSRFSYGGFSGFKWGLTANYFLKNKLYAQVGTQDLVGWISKKYGYGRSLTFGLHYNF